MIITEKALREIIQKIIGESSFSDDRYKSVFDKTRERVKFDKDKKAQEEEEGIELSQSEKSFDNFYDVRKYPPTEYDIGIIYQNKKKDWVYYVLYKKFSDNKPELPEDKRYLNPHIIKHPLKKGFIQMRTGNKTQDYLYNPEDIRIETWNAGNYEFLKNRGVIGFVHVLNAGSTSMSRIKEVLENKKTYWFGDISVRDKVMTQKIADETEMLNVEKIKPILKKFGIPLNRIKEDLADPESESYDISLEQMTKLELDSLIKNFCEIKVLELYESIMRSNVFISVCNFKFPGKKEATKSINKLTMWGVVLDIEVSTGKEHPSENDGLRSVEEFKQTLLNKNLIINKDNKETEDYKFILLALNKAKIFYYGITSVKSIINRLKKKGARITKIHRQ